MDIKVYYIDDSGNFVVLCPGELPLYIKHPDNKTILENNIIIINNNSEFDLIIIILQLLRNTTHFLYKSF